MSNLAAFLSKAGACGPVLKNLPPPTETMRQWSSVSEHLDKSMSTR
ncbi:MAG TPA: hypothetical protein GX393_05900 [Firmicutes bacterium]|nr:hypothetical protein [Bacillota bacterium]